jgi:hypothetical protein
VLALALAAALTAACSSGDDTSGVGSTDSTSPEATTTTPVNGGDVPGGVEDDLFAAESATTAPPADGGDEPASLVANEWGAPEPGEYQYTVGTRGKHAVLEVRDHEAERGRDLHQILIFRQAERADAQLVLWLADGLWMVSEQAREAGGGELPRCDWQPQYLEVPRPAEVGREWAIDSTCQSGSFTRHRQGTARVTGSETIQIKGASYEVFVIERSFETTVRNEDGVPFAGQRRQMTDRWAPSLGLLARSEGTVTTTLEGVEQGSTTDRRDLVDPTPVR